MTDKMIPCPWCNFEFVSFEPFRITTGIPKYGVVCRKCKCHGPLKETIEEAIKAWNTRVELPEITNIDKVGSCYYERSNQELERGNTNWRVKW